MPRRAKESPRNAAPAIVDTNSQSPEDDGYEFDDMSKRTSSKERETSASREAQDEDADPIIETKAAIDEVEFQDLPRPTRRKQPARSGYRERPNPATVEMKSPEDSGFEFHDISYTTPDGKDIIKGISASIAKGEMLAVMGCPESGCSAFLSSLGPGTGKGLTGHIMFEGLTQFDLRAISYVPKGDALLGSLTVRETIAYSLRLSVVESPMKTRDIDELVNTTIAALGLAGVENKKIGNALQHGLSDGDKRKVTIATSLVAYPKILILDEPTSGLDSASARVVMTAVKKIARETGMIVIASIRQPNYELLQLFDNLLLLAKGHLIYSDRTERLPDYMASLGYPVPQHANPSDFIMDLMNPNFNNEDLTDWLTIAWKCSQSPKNTLTNSFWAEQPIETGTVPEVFQTVASPGSSGAFMRSVWILTWRGLISYMRNIPAFGVRLGMYVLTSAMFATIWVRVGLKDSNINDRLSVLFYSIAVLSLMSVAGIPSFLEERAVFLRERKNGLYSSLAYSIATGVTSQPYLFGCTLVFSLLAYWAIGLNSTVPFLPLKFTIALYFAVSAAESQAVLIAALVPHLIVALAITSFLNGFWMSVQGFLIRARNIPVFWYCWAHWVDYQTYAYQLLVKNDFAGLTFQCNGDVDSGCFCSFPSSLITEGVCAVSGDDVIKSLGYEKTNFFAFIGILLVIITVFRVLFWTVLVWKK